MLRIGILNALLLLLLCSKTNFCNAQQTQYTQGKKCINVEVENKTNELIEYYEKQGYVIYKGEYLTVDNKTELPIYLQLLEKKVYAIIVVGHPDLQRMEVKLGHASFGGNEVNDQIIKKRDKTHFTHFVYTPMFTGAFLFTIYEKVPELKNFCSSVFVMLRKENLSTPDK